jgi:hypothetical protein
MNPMSREILSGQISKDSVIMLTLDDVEIRFENLSSLPLEK